MPRRLFGAFGQSCLYVGGFPEYEPLLAKLGRYKRSKACLYLNKLADVDSAVLEEIVRRTYAATEVNSPLTAATGGTER